MTSFRKIIAAMLLLFACAALAEGECKHEWGAYSLVSSGSHSMTCSKCGETRSEAHSLETQHTPATCVSPEIISYVCTKCGYSVSYENGERSKNHEWGAYTTVKMPTCLSEGMRERVCRMCGEVETMSVDKSDHSYGQCTAYDDYWHEKKCVVCGDTVKEHHDTTVSRTVTYATDTRLGKKSFTCTQCGYMFVRYYSATNSKLYSLDSQDIEGYITFETIPVSAGKTQLIKLYPDYVLALNARTDCEITVYANADTLEYRAVNLESGSAILTLQGSGAETEFITASQAAKLTIDPADGIIVSGDYAAVRCDGLNTFMVLSDGAVKAYVYSECAFEADEAGIKTAGGEYLFGACFAYDYDAQKLTAETIGADEMSIAVISDGSEVYAGSGSDSYECAISSSKLAEGWYLTVSVPGTDKVFTSPIFDEYGKLTFQNSKPQERIPEETKDEPEEEKGETEEEIESVPNEISSVSAFEYTANTAPDISVKSSEGVLSVDVSGLASGWNVICVRFRQSYGDTGIRIQNVYSDSAEYDFIKSAGKITVTVIAQDAKGKEVIYTAGSFDCLGY